MQLISTVVTFWTTPLQLSHTRWSNLPLDLPLGLPLGLTSTTWFQHVLSVAERFRKRSFFVEINRNAVGRNRKRGCRKQKVSAESRNWQKYLPFCRKRLVSAERGWFLQKEVDFCRKVGFCRNTERPKAFCRNTVAFLQKESISAERKPFCRNTPFRRK